MSDSTVENAIAAIAAQFESHFDEKLRPLRKIGKEAEFPVVTPNGSSGDASEIVRALVGEHQFEPKFDGDSLIGATRGELQIGIEVGRGTLEIGMPPCNDLWELERQYHSTIYLLARVADSSGMTLLGFGIQPRTRSRLELMTPRPHYRAIYSAIGGPWLRLTTTAADQTHVDIARSELLDAINYLNLLSAPLIALTANSSVYAGHAGTFVSGRERLLKGLGETRYGMTPRKFVSLEEFIHYLCDYKCFVLSKVHNYKVYNLPFGKYLATDSSAMFDEFLWHEHYVWNSARARVKLSTIEVRPACQQPPNEPLAANALILGWVEALPRVADYITQTFGDHAWKAMRDYRRAAVRDGLGAQEPAQDFLPDLVRIAEGGLRKRHRGEERFIEPIWKRLEKRESPGMFARSIFVERGIDRFLAETRINPEG